MNRLNLCILGCGSIARVHSRSARALGPEVSLAYASRSLEKAESYRRRFGGARAFGSYEEACASPDVDAVLVCTPHSLHLEHALLGARHGKHLLIEKPVALTRDELASLEEAVETAGVRCMVAENYHFKPLVRVLRRHLDSGDVGDPLFIGINRTGTRRAEGWRADPEMMGGGALIDGGVHWINLLLSIAGPAREVVAARPAPDPSLSRNTPIEDNIELLIKFEGGAVGRLLHSWNTRKGLGPLQISRIYGTHGNIIFESNGLWVLVLGRRRRLRIPGLRDLMGFRAMLREFVRSVREGREPAMSLKRARQDLEVALAAYRSLDSGRFETLASADADR